MKKSPPWLPTMWYRKIFYVADILKFESFVIFVRVTKSFLKVEIYSQGQKSSYNCPFPYEMAFFQEGVVEGNSAVTPWVSFDSNQA